MTDQLEQLAKPLPASFVKDNPSGYGTYVSHGVITQRLLDVLGPYSQRVVQVIRGDYTHIDKDSKGQFVSKEQRTGVVGAIVQLELTIDGRTVIVEEAGDCENPDNWPHDGARLKDAVSDGLKRCAMREGLGLWLWSQKDKYYLYDHLVRAREESGAASPPDGGSTDSEGVAPPIPETRKVNQ